MTIVEPKKEDKKKGKGKPKTRVELMKEFQDARLRAEKDSRG